MTAYGLLMLSTFLFDFTQYYCERNLKKHFIFSSINDLLHLQLLFSFL